MDLDNTVADSVVMVNCSVFVVVFSVILFFCRETVRVVFMFAYVHMCSNLLIMLSSLECRLDLVYLAERRPRLVYRLDYFGQKCRIS
jgi:hypothetical protein